MKRISIILALSCLFAASLGCQAQEHMPALAQPTPAPVVVSSDTVSHAMKGWELYSWQVADEWNFALLLGTNREKTVTEIMSDAGAIKGVDALKARLAQLPRGEQIFWSRRGLRELGFPPETTVNEIREFAAQLGLTLIIF